MQNRPNPGEYDPFYTGYIELVPEGNIVQILSEQIRETIHMLNGLSEDQSQFSYESGKWTIKEVLGHMADTERIMAYRLLCIARGETISLPGFEENLYVQNAAFNEQSLQELLENLYVIRQSTTNLLKGLKEVAWVRKGNANHSEVTVRAIAYIIAGHEKHHRNILKDRYMDSKDYPLS